MTAFPQELFGRNGLLIFHEKQEAPISPSGGYRLPFSFDCLRAYEQSSLAKDLATQIAHDDQEKRARRLIAATPVMRPIVTLAAASAGLALCEFDEYERRVYGNVKRGERVTLVLDVSIGKSFGKEMIAALEKLNIHVATALVLLDFLPKGDEDEILRRKWFLRENATFRALYTLREVLFGMAKHSIITEELAEHCVSYLQNPKRLHADPLWWMKYHELLARNRII